MATPVFARLNSAFGKVRELFNVFVFEGGSRSSKTFSIIQFFILFAFTHTERDYRVAICRKKGTWLFATVWKDFILILGMLGLVEKKDYQKNASLHTIRIRRTTFEFVGLDDVQKLHGLTVDIFWINEAMEAMKDDFDQLEQRCSWFSILDYNPSAEEHWIYDTVIPRKDCYFDHSTMLDNPFIPENSRRKILSYEPTEENYANGTVDIRKWKIYGLGQRATIEGLVFDNWEIIDKIPAWVTRRWNCLDFGFTCFRGDTLITTSRGDIPISSIRPGDMVLTRKGYKKVIQLKDNGVQQIIGREIVTDLGKTEIFATFNHKFNINGKWKKYGELQETDMLLQLSCSMARSSSDTLPASTQIITTISGKKQENTTPKSCMTRYGRRRTEKYLKAARFTTGISTRLTTIYQIFSSSLKLSIERYIRPLLDSTLSILNINPQSRTRKRIGRIGELSQCRDCHNKSEYASSAVMNSAQQTPISGSVQSNAITSGNIRRRNWISTLYAKCAERLLGAINISSRKLAPQNALISSRAVRRLTDITPDCNFCKVYDLWIEDVHEFFANGILVHNCDPTGGAEVGYYKNCLYIDELLYQTDMTSRDIIKAGKKLFNWEIISESADPRLVKELRQGGLKIHPVTKYAGSVIAGVDFMKSVQKIYVTARSLNAIKELKNYTYQQDKYGKWLNEPVDDYNHIIDGVRYVCMEKLMGKQKGNVKKGVPSGAFR